MQGIAADFHRQVHQLARVQVAGQRVFADEMRLVGALDVQRMAVGLGEHRHRADAHFGTGTHDAHRNFPAVGDQQLLDHAVFLGSMSRRPAGRVGKCPPRRAFLPYASLIDYRK